MSRGFLKGILASLNFFLWFQLASSLKMAEHDVTVTFHFRPSQLYNFRFSFPFLKTWSLSPPNAESIFFCFCFLANSAMVPLGW